jgi:hypothetical protein
MTKLLDSAFKEVSMLNHTEQNIFARFILDEISLEKKWDKSFSNTEDLLSDMADEALKDFNTNKTEILDIKKL